MFIIDSFRFGAGTPALSLGADPGSYSVTGSTAAMLRTYIVPLAAGSYAVTGSDAALRQGSGVIIAGAGSYAVTGTAAALLRAAKIVAAPGSYALTGSAAALTRGSRIDAAAGSYVVTGAAAALVRALKVAAVTGSYTVTGTAATPTYSTGGPTVTYIGTFTDAVTPDPHTFTANVGAAGTKLVVVCPHSLRNAAAQRTISTVSIDGTNGTIAGQTGTNDGANEGTQSGIAYREISTGGSITIVVDWSASHSCAAADVYVITGYSGNTHTDVKTATGNNPTVSTLTVSGGGCVIASASGVEPSTGAFTFSGVTLDHEQQCTGGAVSMREAAGSAAGQSATSTFTVQATSTAGFEALVVASFR